MDKEAAAAAIRDFLRALGHDPEGDDALRDTGSRVASLYADELLDGQGRDLDSLFENAIPCGRSTPLVIVRRLATHVVCPHHLTIGSGFADVAYLPRDRVLGLGDVATIVDTICHRLILQEDACQQIARAFVERLDAHGAMCRLELKHACLTHHGEKKRSSVVTTIAAARIVRGRGPRSRFRLRRFDRRRARRFPAEEEDHASKPQLAMSVAVVTGAGRGIGRAIALALSARGLDVALLGRHESDLEEVARAITIAHPDRRVLALSCDVASSSAVHVAAASVLESFGAPLVVVNNAGVVHRAKIEDTTDDDWDHVLDVNLKGPFLVTRAFLPAMRAKNQGRFIQISSISGTLGTPGLSAYCASKWGLIGFTKSLAEELRGSGLQALTIVPGSVDTEMLKGSGFPPQMTPEDIARVVTFAALEAPDSMNGTSIESFGP